MFEVSKVCFFLFVQYFTLNVGHSPRPLNVVRISDKVIQRKRQDTLEMCKIFDAETNSLATSSVKRHKRVKRDATLEDIADQDDMQRVEKIVEKMYDELNEKLPEKVTYKRRFNVITRPTPSIKNRRVDFHPHMLTVNLDNDTISSAEKEDIEEGPGWYKTGPYRNWAKQWVDGLVPYFIDHQTYDSQLASKIHQAFEYIEKATCIRLQRLLQKPSDVESLDYVLWMYITNPTGIHQCVHSNEQKRAKGVQMIVLGYDCMTQGQITHEVLHVLGFAHEHTRPDRDLHVSIFWDNIKDGYKRYFQMRKEDMLLHLPYDYASVLHYPPRSFSRNGKLTVMPKVDSKLGQREGLSEGDVAKVSAVYGGQCYKRNRRYLIRTCPAVRTQANRENPKPTPAEIEEYYRDKVWPLGLIKYKITDKMEFSTDEIENILSVMDHIEKETCIKFVDQSSFDKEPKNVEKPAGVHPLKDDGNFSADPYILRRHELPVLMLKKETGNYCDTPRQLGRSIGDKEFKVNAGCFYSQDIMLHLFGHIIGLDHQENMHDRDSFLKIDWDSLSGDLKSELSTKLPPAASAGLPYDYQSIMHSPWLSIRNGVQNIIYPIWNDGWSMGNGEGLSMLDVQRINKIYETQCRLREEQASN